MKQLSMQWFIAFLIFFSLSAYSQDYNIYISDAGNFNNPPWQILKMDANGENPEVFTTEDLGWPQDILFLEDQEIALISNLNTGVINRHHCETGALIDNFATGIGGPTRMKIGSDGLLYVLQWGGNGTVWRYELDGTFVDEFTSVGVTQSIGIDWDTDGNLYVSSYSGFVQKFDTAGVDLGKFISTNLAGPTNIWFDDNGILKVLDYNGGAVKNFSADGTYIDDFIPGLSFPEGIAFLPNGHFLIGNGGTASVKEFDADGNFVQDIVASGLAGLLTPNAVVVRPVVVNSVAEATAENLTITPSVGSIFYLNEKEDTKFTRIQIFNAAGQLIENKPYQDRLIWDAQQQASGIYFIHLITKKGEERTQRVVVR